MTGRGAEMSITRSMPSGRLSSRNATQSARSAGLFETASTSTRPAKIDTFERGNSVSAKRP